MLTLKSHNWVHPRVDLREVVDLEASVLNPGQWFLLNQWPLLPLHLPGYYDD